MKKRNQIFKKVGAVLCVCAVFVSLLRIDDLCFASVVMERVESVGDTDDMIEVSYTVSGRMVDDNKYASKGYSFFVDENAKYEIFLPYQIKPYSDNIDYAAFSYVYIYSDCPIGGDVSFSYKLTLDNGDIVYCAISSCPSPLFSTSFTFSGGTSFVVSDGATSVSPLLVFDYNLFHGFGSSEESYSSSIGYLQNVSRKSTYIRDELYNYDDDSLTYHWYHDLTSTGGVDLSSGDYKIRHYISNAKVKGYDKADIVEMSEKYLMNEYDASKGYFSYLQKDYLEKLEALGYVEIGFIDKYLKGYFTLQHHYFQIVNTSTNEVGGYLHFYPKDASGENFGVEMVYEGLDLNDEIDPDAPNGFIDTDVGSGTTIEDALENADAPKLDDLGGIDPLIENLEGYASQITNVTNGIGALLGSLPPWFVGLLGLSFGLFFVLVAVKVLRG